MQVELTPLQDEVLFNTSPSLWCRGGLGSSKTRCIAQMVVHAFGTIPGARVAVCNNTYPQLMRSNYREIQKYCKEIGLKYKLNKQEKIIYYQDCECHLITLNVSPEELLGPEYHIVIIDQAEGVDEDRYARMSERARLFKDWEQGDNLVRVFSNGVPPAHWLSQQYENKRTKLKNHEMVTFSMFTNPYLPQSYIDRVIGKYPAGTPGYKRWVLGETTQLEGAVYPEFDPDVHVVDEIDGKVKFYTHGLDLGFRDPLVLLVGAVTDGGKLYIIDEYYQPERTIYEHHHHLIRMRRPGKIHADHSLRDREALKELGIDTVLGIKDKDIGLQRVRERIRNEEIFILRDKAPNLEFELQHYMWKTTNSGKEETEHKYSHAPDALRYMVMGLDHDAGQTLDELNFGAY